MTKEREIKPVSFNYKNDTDIEILVCKKVI